MIEIRDAGPDAWAVKGLATTWDRPYFVVEPNGDTFREVIERGAFDTAISGVDPVDLRVEHDQRMRPLASTDGGSLAFNDGEKGLVLAAGLLKSDPSSADAVRRVRDGELRGLSVGMVVPGGGDTRGVDKDGRTELRRIYRAHLNEVSLVQSPANPFATISDVRGERQGERIEYRFFPFADLRQWANQHGQECGTCDGSGNCPDCDGQGWTGREDDSDATTGAGRSLFPPNDTDDLRLELEWIDVKAGRRQSTVVVAAGWRYSSRTTRTSLRPSSGGCNCGASRDRSRGRAPAMPRRDDSPHPLDPRGGAGPLVSGHGAPDASERDERPFVLIPRGEAGRRVDPLRAGGLAELAAARV